MLSHLVVLGSPQPASEQVSASCAVVLYALRLRSCVNGSSVTSVRMGLDFKRKSSVPAPLSPQHQSLLASQTNATFEACICRFAQLTLRRIRDITSHCIDAHRTSVGVIKNDFRNDLFALSDSSFRNDRHLRRWFLPIDAVLEGRLGRASLFRHGRRCPRSVLHTATQRRDRGRRRVPPRPKLNRRPAKLANKLKFLGGLVLCCIETDVCK